MIVMGYDEGILIVVLEARRFQPAADTFEFALCSSRIVFTGATFADTVFNRFASSALAGYKTGNLGIYGFKFALKTGELRIAHSWAGCLYFTADNRGVFQDRFKIAGSGLAYFLNGRKQLADQAVYVIGLDSKLVFGIACCLGGSGWYIGNGSDDYKEEKGDEIFDV